MSINCEYPGTVETTTNSSAAAGGGLPERLQDFCFTPDVGRQSILNRRPRSFTFITKDTFEDSCTKERAEFDRKAQTYRVHAQEQYHNSRRLSDGNTFWDDGKIVDRGRGYGTARQMHGTYNPITNTWVAPPQTPERPRSSDDVSYRRQKSIATGCTLGEYNPIHHVWEKQPVGAEQAKREKFEHTQYGFRMPKGHKARVPCPQGIFDPIRGDWIQPPPCNEKLLETAGIVPVAGKRHILNGENWGQHDPISGEWSLLPTSPKYQDPERVALQESGILPMCRTSVLPPEQGIYDPIQNHWVLLPENPRMYGGRSFAPVSKQTFR